MGDTLETLQALEQEVKDLESKVIFCISDYAFHHENNEKEILQQYQQLLNDVTEQCKIFMRSMNKLHNTLSISQRKCSELDVFLNELNK